MTEDEKKEIAANRIRAMMSNLMPCPQFNVSTGQIFYPKPGEDFWDFRDRVDNATEKPSST